MCIRDRFVPSLREQGRDVVGDGKGSLAEFRHGRGEHPVGDLAAVYIDLVVAQRGDVQQVRPFRIRRLETPAQQRALRSRQSDPDVYKRQDEEGARIVAAARDKAEGEREAILQDARHQVALLSIAITEKMLRERLDDEASQTRLAEKMLDEMESRSERKEA